MWVNFLYEQEEELPVLGYNMVSVPWSFLSLLKAPVKKQIESICISRKERTMDFLTE